MSVALTLSSKQMWDDLIVSDIHCVSYPDCLVFYHLPCGAGKASHSGKREENLFWVKYITFIFS